MALDRLGSTPLYVQLKDLIADDIERGHLKPGDRVGSEAELERSHRVSRITVRQALAALVHEGEVYRVPGKGTYVAAPKVEPLAAFTSFSENMAAQGLTASYRCLAAVWTKQPPARVRADLRLAPDEPAFCLERLMLADDTPMCVQRGFYAGRFLAPAAAQLTPERLAASFYRLLERGLGLTLGTATETVEPSIANREEVGLFGVAAGTPVLVVNRLSYLVSGEPIETVKLVFRGDKYRYRVDLDRTSGAWRASG